MSVKISQHSCPYILAKCLWGYRKEYGDPKHHKHKDFQATYRLNLGKCFYWFPAHEAGLENTVNGWTLGISGGLTHQLTRLQMGSYIQGSNSGPQGSSA